VKRGLVSSEGEYIFIFTRLAYAEVQIKRSICVEVGSRRMSCRIVEGVTMATFQDKTIIICMVFKNVYINIIYFLLILYVK